VTIAVGAIVKVDEGAVEPPSAAAASSPPAVADTSAVAAATAAKIEAVVDASVLVALIRAIVAARCEAAGHRVAVPTPKDRWNDFVAERRGRDLSFTSSF